MVSQGGAYFDYFDEPVAGGPAGLLLLEGAPLVRIRSLTQAQERRYAQVEPVSRPSSTVPASEISALKDEIEALARRSEAFRLRLLESNTAQRFTAAYSGNRQPAPFRAALTKRDGTFRAGFYELDRVQSFSSAEALTTWLIYMLDLPIQYGLELLARSDADRIVELRKVLASR